MERRFWRSREDTGSNFLGCLLMSFPLGRVLPFHVQTVTVEGRPMLIQLTDIGVLWKKGCEWSECQRLCTGLGQTGGRSATQT